MFDMMRYVLFQDYFSKNVYKKLRADTGIGMLSVEFHNVDSGRNISWISQRYQLDQSNYPCGYLILFRFETSIHELTLHYEFAFRTAHLYVAKKFGPLNQLLMEQKENFNDPNDNFIREHMWIIFVPQVSDQKDSILPDLFSSTPLRLDSAVYAFQEQSKI